MRRVEVGTLLRVLLGIAASAALTGCPGQELAPLSPCTVSAVAERVDQSGNSQVDLLFMIDNSGSMATKQKKLGDQLPRLLKVLTSGDRCAGQESTCTLDETTTPKRTFTPVSSLHLGVVTSNMGGVDEPPTGKSNEAIGSCRDLGDDGVLQTSTQIAAQGVTVVKDGEFGGRERAGDVLLEPLSECEDVGSVDSYQTYDATAPDPEASLQEVEKKFACVSRVGVRGCPFEQQLEAPWKALAPSNQKGEQYTFLNGSDAHGNTDNEGFLRADAILAILLVTDEDDCSITDEGKDLFLSSGEAGRAARTKYGNLNTRCGDHGSETNLIHATSRYVDGFKSLKPDNTDRVIFAAITGVPQDAVAANMNAEEILALPAMQFAHADGGDLPNISCANNANTEVAYPPIRIVQVARDFGLNSVLYSVCEEDYAPALNLLIEKIANKLTGNCLPHALNPDPKHQVNCVVFELLPEGVTECDPDFGLSGMPEKRETREGKVKKTRLACKMDPVKFDGDRPVKDAKGWYYDNFSEDVESECGAGLKQRISFQFAKGTQLPPGAGATFECFQPVAKIEKNTKGFDAINTSCSADGDECAQRSNKKEGGYDLFCMTNSCQVSCKSNPECPPGWVCHSSLSDSTSPKFCQQPTCPSDDSQDMAAPDAG